MSVRFSLRGGAWGWVEDVCACARAFVCLCVSNCLPVWWLRGAVLDEMFALCLRVSRCISPQADARYCQNKAMSAVPMKLATGAVDFLAGLGCPRPQLHTVYGFIVSRGTEVKTYIGLAVGSSRFQYVEALADGGGPAHTLWHFFLIAGADVWPAVACRG